MSICLIRRIEVDKNYGEYALIMKALGDETRIEISDMLSGGELCACKILGRFNITQPTLSYHMKILIDSGLVNGRREGIWMKYSINNDKLQKIRQFFESIDTNIRTKTIFNKQC